MDSLEALKKEAVKALNKAPNLGAVRNLERDYLGKSGKITAILKELKNLPEKERKTIGRAANAFKHEFSEMIKRRKEELQKRKFEEQLQKEWIEPEAWIKFYKEVDSLRAKYEKWFIIRYEPAFILRNEFTRYADRMSSCIAKKRLHAQVDAQGNVYPCVLLLNTRIFKLGNIREERFSVIWKCSQKWKLIDSLPSDKKCRSCKFLEFCKGGCKAYTYHLKGSLTLRDPRCSEKVIPVCPCSIYPPLQLP